VSSRIDTLEPNGEPLAHLLASIVAQTSVQDFAQPQAPTCGHDIAHDAQRAIAGVPLGSAQTHPRPDRIAKLRSILVARMRACARLVERARHRLVGFVPILRNACNCAFDAMRRHGAAILRLRASAIPGSAGTKFGAGLAATALGLALVLIYTSGRFARSPTPSEENALVAQMQPAGGEQLAEERPVRDDKREFTRANLRYCTFQQIRLEALGPITEGADLLVFNALVEDWNIRCTKVRYRAEDKDAVDAEARMRRALLRVEGRALMNGWRRKIVTTVQQLPSFADLDSGEAAATGSAVAATPEQASETVERLPLLITQGRATAGDPDRDTALSLKTPALALLRADVAMRVQRRLNDLGYTIAVDGTWGTGSRAALRRFKKASGLLGNDAFDAETVARLFSTLAVAAPAGRHDDEAAAAIETVYPPPPLADMNPLNRADGQRIQQRLAALGYYNGRGDGTWDPAARAALRKFKAANGLGHNEDRDDWDASTETVLFDEQAVRSGEPAASDPRKTPASAAAAPVPLPPKRPMPPAKAGEHAAAIEPPDARRPPRLIPGPTRGAASRSVP
jgi:peptidoglycan hydrolase-like protein with peptidoglycan-binding domain